MSSASQSNLSLGNLVLNGSHSRPLSFRVQPGQTTAWAAGDWGTDHHGSRDGSLGLSEVGWGYNTGNIQWNLSLGQTWASQDLALGGSLEGQGAYVLTEALAPVSDNLWGAFGLYYQWGDVDIRRGYVNGSSLDYSTGSPDSQTWALRARLQWDNVAKKAGYELSPYLDLSYIKTRVDGYTEQGGGFPAQFATTKAHATDLRVGAVSAKQMTSHTKLVGMLEGVHRFEGNGPNISGSLGVLPFSVPGAGTKQNWLRIGLGMESQMGNGRASVMLHGSSEGAAADYWLEARYQFLF